MCCIGLSILLVSCGENANSPAPLVSGTVSISGIAADGPIAGGTVTVTDAAGAVIATDVTKNDGTYAISVPNNAALPLELTIFGGVDLVSNQPQGFPLTTVVTQTISQLTQVNANANAFTSIIVASAKAEAAAQGVSLDFVLLANVTAKVVANLGFGLDPAFDPIHTPVTAMNVADISKANEALSEFIRRTTLDKIHQDNAVAAATAKITNTTAIPQVAKKADMQSVIAMLAVDVSDGVLDGYASNKAVLDAAVASALKRGITPANPVEVQALAVLAQVNTVEVLAEVLTNRLKITDTAGTVIANALTTQVNMDKYAAVSVGLNPGSTAAKQISMANIDTSKSYKFLKKQIAVAIATAKAGVVNNDTYSASSKIQASALQGQQLDAMQASMTRFITAQLERAAGTLTQAQVDVYTSNLRAQVDSYSNAMSATRIDAITTATVQLMASRMQQKSLAVSGLDATPTQITQAKNEVVLQVATAILPKVMKNTVLAQTKGSANLLINPQVTAQTASTVVQQLDANVTVAQQAAFSAATANPAVLNRAINLSSNTLSIQDYDVTGRALLPIQATAHVVGKVMNLALPTLNAGNAANLSAGKLQAKKQLVYLAISTLPPIGSKGVATVQVIVKDDSTRGLAPVLGRLRGERYAQSSFVINWEVIQDAQANARLLIAGAAGQASNSYISGSGGTTVQITQSNANASILSVSSVLKPTGKLDTKIVVSIASLFTSVAKSIPGLANLRVTGDYFYWIDLQGIPFRDMNGNLFTTIQGTMPFK